MPPPTTEPTEFLIANQRNLRRLVLSVRASLHKLNLLLAICDNPFYRDDLIRTYEAELTPKRHCLLSSLARSPTAQP